MTTLIMMKGLPGSGKSVWAKKRVLEATPGTLVRINKDDLRSMLHADRWHGKHEKQVVRARDTLIESNLAAGVSVIVDDTNFNPVHETRLRDLAKKYDAGFKIADHTAVELHTCIANDLKRNKSVGEKVIRDMHGKYLATVPAVPPVWDHALEDAVIVDLDGTLARMVDRGPFEWSKVGSDEPIESVVNLVRTLNAEGTCTIIFVSGRKDTDGCRAATRKWLIRHVGDWTVAADLHMRGADDNRKDTEVKAAIYRNSIAGRYNVDFVLDDRDSVVAMWRSMGLTCLQVAPGPF